MLVREDKQETAKHKAIFEARRKAMDDEKKRQEEEGIVTKPSRVGSKLYKMKKTDF